MHKCNVEVTAEQVVLICSVLSNLVNCEAGESSNLDPVSVAEDWRAYRDNYVRDQTKPIGSYSRKGAEGIRDAIDSYVGLIETLLPYLPENQEVSRA